MPKPLSSSITNVVLHSVVNLILHVHVHVAKDDADFAFPRSFRLVNAMMSWCQQCFKRMYNMHNNVIKISTISKSYVFTQKKERYTVRRQPSFVTFWWSVVPSHTLLVCEGRMWPKVLHRDRCREEVRSVHVGGDVQHCVILRGIPPCVVQCRRQFGFARRHYEHSNVTNLNACTKTWYSSTSFVYSRANFKGFSSNAL